MSTISKVPENKVARPLNNRIASLLAVAAVIVVALGLMTIRMIPTGSTSVRVESNEQALREYQLGERYGVLPEHNVPLSAEQIQREYILGERFGETPQQFTREQALREYWLGERYGQTP